MTQTELLQKVRALLGARAYVEHNPKAVRDPAERRANQERAHELTNIMAGIASQMKARTKLLQDTDAIYQAHAKEYADAKRNQDAAERGTAWRYVIGYRWQGAIFNMRRQVAHGANAADALRHLTDELTKNPNIATNAKAKEPRRHD